MAIAITNLLEEADTTGGDPVTTTGSVTTVAGRYYIVTVHSSTDPTVASVTLPGTITEAEILNEVRGTVLRVSVWSGECTSGGTGTVTVDFSGATSGTIIIVDEVTGHDTTGTIVQAVGNDGSSGTASATLAAFGDATNNAGYFGCGINSAIEIVEEATFTELGQGSFSTPTRAGITAWDIGQDTSPSATFTSSQWAIVALEIKADTGAAAAAPKRLLLLGAG